MYTFFNFVFFLLYPTEVKSLLVRNVRGLHRTCTFVHLFCDDATTAERIGRNLCRLGKLNIYYLFIMSNFNYCPLVWHFCGEVNTKKIEKIQERALRFIYQDYNSSYDTLLDKSKLPSLKVRRLRAIALEAFKILNNRTPVYLNDILTYKPHSYYFRYTNTGEIPQVRTSSYGVRSFRSTAAKIWNSLLQKFRDITSTEQFRSHKLVHGAGGGGGGGGSAHARSAQTVNAYVLSFCCF